MSQENKIDEVDVTNESNVTNDSGIQLTPMLASKNKKPDEIIISEAGAKSTPVVTNIKEKEYSIDDIFNLVKTMSENMVRNSDFKEQDVKNESRFDEIKNNFSEKLNEIRNEIKQQNVYINKSLKEVSEHFSVIVKQVQDLSLIHI